MYSCYCVGRPGFVAGGEKYDVFLELRRRITVVV